ncbi:hypothetical protein Q5P01_000383, partial [Channa striata]
KQVELSTASLLKVAPTDEERKIVHSLFLNTLDTNFCSRILPPNSVWMEDAKLKGLETCHPQHFQVQRSFRRRAAEAADRASWRGDILFQKPVEIGSLLLLSSQVCYSQGSYIQVRVHREVFDPLTRQHNTTSVLHYTFISDCEVPNIIPKTYGESMLYLDGKTHFNQTVGCEKIKSTISTNRSWPDQ